jgi:hypothetical protein
MGEGSEGPDALAWEEGGVMICSGKVAAYHARGCLGNGCWVHAVGH